VLAGPPSLGQGPSNPNAAAAAASAGAAGGTAPSTPGALSPGDGRPRPVLQNVPRSSASNLPRTSDQGAVALPPEQSGSHMSPNVAMQPGNPLPSLGLHVMDGQPNSPTLPLTPHSPEDTPRSQLDDIINGTRNSDFHDFLSSLGDHDDADLGMEF
jgi:hypothetical protein